MSSLTTLGRNVFRTRSSYATVIKQSVEQNHYYSQFPMRLVPSSSVISSVVYWNDKITTSPSSVSIISHSNGGLIKPVCSGRNYSSFRSSGRSGDGDDDQRRRRKRRSTLYYLAAVGVLVVGGSYAAVPLYRIFCQSYSYGGTTGTHDNTKDLSQMKRLKDKEITIRFNADMSSNLLWNFRPEQTEIVVTPGETALAFYRAENRTPKPIDGVSTYNVIPFEAGQYFNKIQCFCFEEQRLNPGETVELPVFFYIDPEFGEDPRMETVDLITLSYTFFESKEMPGWANSGVWSGGGHHGGDRGKVLNA